MDPKLTIFFLLIGTIIGLSHYDDGNVVESKRQLDGRNWYNVAGFLRSGDWGRGWEAYNQSHSSRVGAKANRSLVSLDGAPGASLPIRSEVRSGSLYRANGSECRDDHYRNRPGASVAANLRMARRERPSPGRVS